MLGHPDLDNGVEALVDVPVILKADLHPTLQPLPRDQARPASACVRDNVTPTPLTPYSRAAWMSSALQPQPMSSSRIPGRRSSLRQITSILRVCATSSGSVSLRQ